MPRITLSGGLSHNDAEPLYLHTASFGESNQFERPVMERWVALTPERQGNRQVNAPYWNTPPLTLSEHGDRLQVEFSWHEVPGMPRRHHLHMRERFELAHGQWGQIVFNARHQDSNGHWFYEKHAVNIGLADEFTPGLFVDISPQHHLADLAILR